MGPVHHGYSQSGAMPGYTCRPKQGISAWVGHPGNRYTPNKSYSHLGDGHMSRGQYFENYPCGLLLLLLGEFEIFAVGVKSS